MPYVQYRTKFIIIAKLFDQVWLENVTDAKTDQITTAGNLITEIGQTGADVFRVKSQPLHAPFKLAVVNDAAVGEREILQEGRHLLLAEVVLIPQLCYPALGRNTAACKWLTGHSESDAMPLQGVLHRQLVRHPGQTEMY